MLKDILKLLDQYGKENIQYITVSKEDFEQLRNKKATGIIKVGGVPIKVGNVKSAVAKIKNKR